MNYRRWDIYWLYRFFFLNRYFDHLVLYGFILILDHISFLFFLYTIVIDIYVILINF